MKTKIIGIRFFSIFGEWGRPDMLILKYLLASKFKKPFEIFNYGNHYRDFTYIKDVNHICEKLITIFREPFLIDKHLLHTTLSIGIALFAIFQIKETFGKDLDYIEK